MRYDTWKGRKKSLAKGGLEPGSTVLKYVQAHNLPSAPLDHPSCILIDSYLIQSAVSHLFPNQWRCLKLYLPFPVCLICCCVFWYFFCICVCNLLFCFHDFMISLFVLHFSATIPFWNQLGLKNKVCDNCIISPLGGDRWLLKNVFVIESFIQKRWFIQ